MSIPETILLVSAVIVALGVIRAALRGTRRVLRMADRLVTLLTEMTAQLGGTPNAFEILEQIIAQFRTDSGSSLRDQINSLTDSVAGLTEAARTAERVASLLEDRVETVKQVASDERRQHARDQASIMRLLQHLEGTVAALSGAATDAASHEPSG